MKRPSLTIAFFFFAAFLLLISRRSPALVEIGYGSTAPLDGNWPLGVKDAVNSKSRVAWVDGPIGGRLEIYFRGNTAAFQETLDLFAKIRAPERRLIIHEGPHEEDLVKNPRDAAPDAHVDWSLTLWDPQNWHAFYNNPQSIFGSIDPSGHFRSPVDPPTLEVYVAPAAPPEGLSRVAIDWKAIKLPAGITVLDQRATANGYRPDDGNVLRGDIYDLLTSKPLPASISLEGYDKNISPIPLASADADGHFEIKHVPAAQFRITISAPGHAPRSLGYVILGNNAFREFTVTLAKSATLKGTIRDTAGKPLPNIKLIPENTLALDGRTYLLPASIETTTDAQGAFEISGIPQGYLQLYARADTYQQLDSQRILAAPSAKLELVMTATGAIQGKVLKPDGTPATAGNVSFDAITNSPDKVGTYGGGTSIHPDGTFEFNNVPPGQYTITPSFHIPGNTTPDPYAKTITVHTGETTQVELTSPK